MLVVLVPDVQHLQVLALLVLHLLLLSTVLAPLRTTTVCQAPLHHKGIKGVIGGGVAMAQMADPMPLVQK